MIDKSDYDSSLQSIFTLLPKKRLEIRTKIGSGKINKREKINVSSYS